MCCYVMEWKTLVYIVSLLQNKQEGGRERLYRESGIPLVQIKGSVITLEKYPIGEF